MDCPWDDKAEKLGPWVDAFTTGTTNPSGQLQSKADFSKPRMSGQATKRRRKETE